MDISFHVLAALLFVQTLAAWGASPQAIRFRVEDSSDQKPLPEVVVEVHHPNNPLASGIHGQTDAEGLWGFVPNQDIPTRLEFRKSGWTPVRWDRADAHFPTNPPLVISLAQTQKLSGQIQDAQGRPVAGCRVFFNFAQRLSGPHVPVDDLPATTDSQGRWQSEIVPRDAESISVTVVGEGLIWDGSQPQLAALQTGKTILKVTRLAGLSGRVVDPLSAPVAGARVLMGDSWGIDGTAPQTETVTDAEGRFQLPSVEPGPRQFAAFAVGHGPVQMQVEVTPGGSMIELKLTRPSTWNFRVVDLKGSPIVGLEGQVDEWRQLRAPGWQFRTDSEGRFRLTNAPADEIRATFRHTGYMSLPFVSFKIPLGEQIVEMGPPLRIHGRVLDASTSKPVPAFKIRTGWARQTVRDGKLVSEGGQFSEYAEPKRFLDGTFSIDYTEPPIVGAVKPQDFVLKPEADGYGSAISSPVSATIGEAEVDFRLTPPQFLGGRILLPDGRPAGRVLVHIVQKQYELQTLNGRVERAGNGTEIVTDAEGRFSLPKTEQPRILVVSHDTGFAGFTDAQLGQTNEITLTRWARISGKIRRGSGVGSKVQVALWIPQEWIFKDKRSMEPALQPFGTYQMTTDEDGRFEFDRVPPGEVAIGTVDRFLRPNGRLGALTGGEVWGGRRRARIRIAPGDSQHVEIGGQGRTVTGSIRSPGAFAHVDVKLNRVLPPIPYPDGPDLEARKKWVAEWFWSERGAPYRLWLAQMPSVLPNGWNRDPAAPWQVHRREDGSITLVDVPAGEYVLMAEFLAEPSSVTQVAARIRRSERKFTVDPGEDLQSLPPMDLAVH